MSRFIPADPASLSASAIAAAQAARRVGAAGESLEAAYSAVHSGWTGPRARESRNHAELLGSGIASLVTELRRTAVLLQDHATALAELIAQERGIADEVSACGLEIRDGRVAATLGVHGEADAATITTQQAQRSALQDRLDRVRTRYTRRRDDFAADLETSRDALAQTGAQLRLG
jgi:uncharacterized protein YukE